MPTHEQNGPKLSRLDPAPVAAPRERRSTSPGRFRRMPRALPSARISQTQADACLAKIAGYLTEAGATMDAVVMLTFYTTDIGGMGKVREVRSAT